MKRTIGCPPARRSRSVTHGMLKPLSPISIRKCATCIGRLLVPKLWGRRAHGVRVCDGRDDDDDTQAHSRGRAARRLARRSSRGWHARAEHTRATGANGAESRRAKAWEGRRREAHTLRARFLLACDRNSRAPPAAVTTVTAVSPDVSPLPFRRCRCPGRCGRWKASAVPEGERRAPDPLQGPTAAVRVGARAPRRPAYQFTNEANGGESSD